MAAAEQPRVLVVGIGGATCSGKTTVVGRLCQQLQHTLCIHQDDFYLQESEIPTSEEDTQLWDASTVPEALDVQRFEGRVREMTQHPQAYCSTCLQQPVSGTHLLLVEGTMVLTLRALKCYYHLSFFITADFDLCRSRRRQRSLDGEVAGQPWVHSIADPPGYVEEHVWPAYLRDKATLEQDGSTCFVDGNKLIDEVTAEISLGICKMYKAP